MGDSPASTLILIAVMVVAFYFLILRPQRKRQQAQQQTINTLIPGARVVTGSGFYGTIVEIGEKQAVLEISPGAHLTVLKQAIARVVPAGEEDEDRDGYDDELDEAAEPVGIVDAGNPAPGQTDPGQTYPDDAFADPNRRNDRPTAGNDGSTDLNPGSERPRDAS